MRERGERERGEREGEREGVKLTTIHFNNLCLPQYPCRFVLAVVSATCVRNAGTSPMK